MEGIWYPDPSDSQPDPRIKRQIADWDTLPVPSSRHWSNVMYQFHFYHWYYVDANGKVLTADENFPSHKDFIDQKIAIALVKQPRYNVPVMIGEFYGFGLSSIWNYYIQNFNAQKWSWTSWSYKYHDSPSNWGVVYHADYNESPPSVQNDYYQDLTRKFSEYTTADYHLPNATLQGIISASANSLKIFPSQPYISSLSTLFILPGHDFFVTGKNFGNASDSHSINYNGASQPIISWSDTSIHSYIRSTEPGGSGPVTVTTPRWTSNGVDLIIPVTTPLPSPPPPGMSTSGGQFTYYGYVGDTPGTIQFYWAPCSDIPPGTHPCNYGNAAITYWRSPFIKGYVPPDALMTNDQYTINSPDGGDLYPTMMRLGDHAPVLGALSSQVVNAGHDMTIVLNATDPDGDVLGYTGYPLPAGASVSGHTFTWTPALTQAGQYVVTFTVSDGQLSSQKTITITVKSPLPDLLLTALSKSTNTLAPGGNFTASATVKNQQSTAAGTFEISYHLSTDGAYGGADDYVLNGVSLVNSLNGSSSLNVSSSLTVPSSIPAGMYYLCAQADSNNVIIEKSETNNTRCSSVPMNIVLPDLTVTSVACPLTGTRNGNITINSTVVNIGTARSGAFNIGFYLSNDLIISTGDVKIGRRRIPGLATGGSVSTSTVVTIPASLTAGPYYCGVIANFDNKITESNQSNNSLSGNSITVN